MKRLKNTMIAIVAFMANACFATTPQIKNVKAFQPYPWEAKIYISYEVEGDIAASAGNGNSLFAIAITAKDKTSGQIYGEVWSTDSYLTGDTGISAGLHKVVWNVAAQGLTINSDNVVFTVEYRDDAYMVVDLSAGANASSYPVCYLGNVPPEGWTDAYKTTKLVLRRIPAGTYKMQNSDNVKLTKPFYCGVFEVTQKQYLLVMGSNPSGFKGDMLPVEKVSYNAIRGSAQWPTSAAVGSTSFMGKLRARTGLDFDLPTEAQWEYACRAGTTTKYYWGYSMNNNYAWYSDNSSGTTHKVGTTTPNAWGLYDTSGNVWEWCLDWYGNLASGVTDPKGSSSGSSRVLRGGGWNDLADGCTSSNRDGFSPSGVYSSHGDGFRLVRTLSNE